MASKIFCCLECISSLLLSVLILPKKQEGVKLAAPSRGADGIRTRITRCQSEAFYQLNYSPMLHAGRS